MGGQLGITNTHQSISAPWTVHASPYYTRPPTVIAPPLWKELPWHLEHPALFAFIAGSLFTGALWVLAQ